MPDECRRAKRLIVDIPGFNAPLLEPRNQTLHHRLRTTDIELIAHQLEGRAEQGNIHPPSLLVVDAGFFVIKRIAETELQVKVFVFPFQSPQMLLHNRFAAIANAIIEPDVPTAAAFQQAVDDTQHWCDTDTAANQDNGQRLILHQMEMAGGCLHLQNASFMYVIVEVIGGDAWRYVGLICWCGHPFD